MNTVDYYSSATDRAPVGQIVVTEYDQANQTVSGTFHFEAYKMCIRDRADSTDLVNRFKSVSFRGLLPVLFTFALFTGSVSIMVAVKVNNLIVICICLRVL